MKKFLKIAGFTVLAVVVILYLSFLVIVPWKVDLNGYKPQIQKLVKENTGLNIDFGRIDVITTPFLEAGFKTENIKVTLPDDSVLFSADSFKGKVFLPSLIRKSVRVTLAEINSPKINLEIVNGEKYKFAKAYEDVVNEKRKQKLNPDYEAEIKPDSSFDMSDIKIYVSPLKLNNYRLTVDDTAASHKLILKGDQIRASYYNGDSAKLIADAKLYNDKQKNITAKLNIDSYIPAIRRKDKIEDNEAVFELPFYNPVSVYRDYDLKSDIDTKIKIRRGKKDDKLWAKGYINIGDTAVTLSDLELPKSYLKINAKGKVFDIDTKIFATQDEYFNIAGLISTGKHPYLVLTCKSTKVHLQNLLNIARAYLDTIHIKNDVANMNAKGYIYSNFKIKTDYDDINSSGKFIIRGGDINDGNIGLLFENIKANVILDNDMLVIRDTSALINKSPLQISGTIGENSDTDINIYANRIPLTGLYKAFAPRQIKEAYNLNSGYLSIDSKIKGEIKSTIAFIRAELQDFNFTDKNGLFRITDKLAKFGFAMTSDNIKGKFVNKDFRFIHNGSGSVVLDEFLKVHITNKKAELEESDIRFNKNSIIKLSGVADNYFSNPDIHIIANGFLKDDDIKTFLGDAASLYFSSRGAIPLKADFISRKDRTRIAVQMQSGPDSYITPVDIKDLIGKSVLFQLYAEKRDNNLKVQRSGIYVRPANATFSDNFMINHIAAREIAELKILITNMHRKPFLSLFRLSLPHELEGSVCAFPGSKFYLTGNVNAYGILSEPKINGKFNITKIEFPQWLTKIRDITVNIVNKNVKAEIRDVDANGSDFDCEILSDFNNLAKMKISNLDLRSGHISVDKILKVSEGLISSLPQNEVQNAAGSAEAQIPVEILNGSVFLRKITSGKIVLRDTRAKISLLKSILYINKLKTALFGGSAEGDVSVNLLNQEIAAKLSGKNFDIERMLQETVEMKDALSGEMNFISDVKFKGTTTEEQMKSLKGFIDFNLKAGQLGPFGKFENFLMAENIRENAFFSSAIGSIITNIVTFDTSRYNSLYGHLTFEDGYAQIAPIKSQGDVMSLYLFGKAGLIDTNADITVRGKLGSAFSDKLGPLANINPVNLVKNTPGLNVVLAKTFSIFCQAVSEEEMAAIPPLGDGRSDEYATKFQLKLRGDTRKPLKMIKSFKWLALDSQIESAQHFVDTIPVPEAGEEGMSVEEIIKLREEQAQIQKEQEKKDNSLFGKIKHIFIKKK